MRKLYEFGDREKITLYKPFFRSLIQHGKGYVIEISSGGNIERYPAFPRHFQDIHEVNIFIHGRDAALADRFNSYLKDRIKKERRSRLHPDDTVQILVEDIDASLSLIEDINKYAESRLSEQTLRAIQEIQLMEETIEDAQQEILRMKRVIPQLERLNGIPEAELDAIFASLHELMPEKTDISPASKYEPVDHTRPRGYHEFARRICEIPFVTNVKDWGRARKNNRSHVRITEGKIIVTYKGDRPQEMIVGTTAKDPTQQKIAAAYIKQALFNK